MGVVIGVFCLDRMECLGLFQGQRHIQWVFNDIGAPCGPAKQAYSIAVRVHVCFPVLNLPLHSWYIYLAHQLLVYIPGISIAAWYTRISVPGIPHISITGILWFNIP